MKFPQVCVIIFCKEPVPGRVKTRLIPALGAEGACQLHQILIKHLLEPLQKSQLCHFQLWVDNNVEHPTFASFHGERKIQQGHNLGEKMYHATTSVLKGYEQVIIIGSDCPQIDEDYLHQAIISLTDNNDVVLGPAEDGGYVLIGMSSPQQQIFENINWGSSQVLAQTQQALKSAGLSWHELRLCFDIDRPQDLKKLEGVGITLSSLRS